MGGRLIAVVGPSGVGKDSVIDGLCARHADLHRVTRYITRPAGAGGEEFHDVSHAQFARMRDQGDFVLSWGAHDLHYGVPVTVLDVLAGGQDAIVNLSRGVLREASSKFDNLWVIALSAPPEVLAQRLATRGRESPQIIARRLARRTPTHYDGVTVTEIRNDRPLNETLSEIEARFFQVSV